ncbi:hypothetical protein [Nitrososphaera viennensis]|uniref:Uncharacterized protein n=1 Tax=Nitrososphaera viennensis TaxID=1034015 RepID=A0A977ID89_9ARCH|nr:hypothetical protein [Nitrososphaera viennensis]UVS68670.1 hypothetical protein NWT39_12285 [Nitrososphaera viennensis]
MSEFQTALDLAQIATAAAAAVAAGVAVWQSKMTKQQIDSRLRPWIGTKEIMIAQDKIEVVLTNYGGLPALSAVGKSDLSDKVLTIADLKGQDDKNTMGTIMPNSEKFYIMELSDDPHKKILSFGYVVEYTYAGGKQGEYGMIAKLGAGNRRFEIIQEWTK